MSSSEDVKGIPLEISDGDDDYDEEDEFHRDDSHEDVGSLQIAPENDHEDEEDEEEEEVDDLYYDDDNGPEFGDGDEMVMLRGIPSGNEVELDSLAGNTAMEQDLLGLAPDDAVTELPVNFNDLQEIFKAEQRGLRFHRYLFLNSVPEWRRKYVHYNRLSKLILRIVEVGAPVFDDDMEDEVVGKVVVSGVPVRSTGSNISLPKLSNEQIVLMEAIQGELTKVDEFYTKQYKDTMKQCTVLFHQIKKWRGKEEEGLTSLRPSSSSATVHARSRGLSFSRTFSRQSAAVRRAAASSSSSSDDDDDEDDIDDTDTDEDEEDTGVAVRRKRRMTLTKGLSGLATTQQHLIEKVDERKKQRRFEVAVKAFDHAGSELIRGIRLLSSYCALNKLAMLKIAKKHDTLTEDISLPTLTSSIKGLMQSCKFVTVAPELIQVEKRLTGDLSEALGNGARRLLKMTQPNRDAKNKSTWASFIIGISAGLSFALLVLCVYLLITTKFESLPDWSSSFLVHRCMFLPMLMVFYTGVNMHVWRRRRINYTFINEIPDNQSISPLTLWAIISPTIAAVLLSFDLYLLNASGNLGTGMPAKFHGFILLIIMLLFLLNPFNFWFRDTRFWLLSKGGRVLAAPFKKVHFTDFYLADQFTSLAMFFYDAEYTLCWMFSDLWTNDTVCLRQLPVARLVIGVLPYTWRLMQCFRRYRDTKDVTNLYNAGKYSTGIFVVITAAIRFALYDPTHIWATGERIVSVVALIIATGYTSCWDIYMDWGLLEKGSRHRFLRDELLYDVPNNWVYYFAVVTNTLLRLTWIFTLIPPRHLGIEIPHLDMFYLGVAVGECSRRFQWNFFRMENEMANNCGRFRAIKEVPLPFLDTEESEDQILIDADNMQSVLAEDRPLSRTVRFRAQDDIPEQVLDSEEDEYGTTQVSRERYDDDLDEERDDDDDDEFTDVPRAVLF